MRKRHKKICFHHSQMALCISCVFVFVCVCVFGAIQAFYFFASSLALLFSSKSISVDSYRL